MNNIVFEPWVGKDYCSMGYNNKKILILGESHYCDRKQCVDNYCRSGNMCKKIDFTGSVLYSFLKYKKGAGGFKSWMRTFTRFTNIFIGQRCDDETIITFWNSVVFYNYVQEALEYTRMTPTEEMYKKSEKPFFEVLEKYNPDLVICWGIRLSKHLPDGGFESENVIDERGKNLYCYNNGKQDIPVYAVYHPASSKLTYDCSKDIKKVFEQI